MKKSILFGCIFFFISAFQAKAQVAFSVSPGLSLNSAYFGYKVDKFVPFIGVQFLNANVDYSTNGSMDGDVSSKLKATIFMPTLGLKYFPFEKGDVQGYFLASLTKPFISGKDEENGIEDPDFNQAIDNISIWAGQLGFGAEYFFSDNFSLGGEFGIMLAKVKTMDSYSEITYDQFGNPSENTVSTETKVGFNPTYTKISLNYYF